MDENIKVKNKFQAVLIEKIRRGSEKSDSDGEDKSLTPSSNSPRCSFLSAKYSFLPIRVSLLSHSLNILIQV